MTFLPHLFILRNFFFPSNFVCSTTQQLCVTCNMCENHVHPHQLSVFLLVFRITYLPHQFNFHILICAISTDCIIFFFFLKFIVWYSCQYLLYSTSKTSYASSRRKSDFILLLLLFSLVDIQLAYADFQLNNSTFHLFSILYHQLHWCFH